MRCKCDLALILLLETWKAPTLAVVLYLLAYFLGIYFSRFYDTNLASLLEPRPLPAWSISQRITLINWNHKINDGWVSDQDFSLRLTLTWMFYQGWGLGFPLRLANVKKSSRLFYVPVHVQSTLYEWRLIQNRRYWWRLWKIIPRNFEMKIGILYTYLFTVFIEEEQQKLKLN